MDVRQLWHFHAPVRVSFLFHSFAKSEAIRSALYESIIFIPSVDTVFGCHVLQKGKAVFGNISRGSSDLPQFGFIYKLLYKQNTLLLVNHASHQMELNSHDRPYHNWIPPNLLHSALKLLLQYQRTASWSIYSKFSSQRECKTCLLFSGPNGGKNLYSWHNIISIGLLENNSICKDGNTLSAVRLKWQHTLNCD